MVESSHGTRGSRRAFALLTRSWPASLRLKLYEEHVLFNARWGNTCTSDKQPFIFRAVYWNISRLDFPDCRFVDDFFAPTRGFSTPARGFSTALGGAVSVVLANSTLTGRGSVISCRRSSSASTCFFRLTIPTETMWRFPLRRSGHFAASPCSSTWTM